MQTLNKALILLLLLAGAARAQLVTVAEHIFDPLATVSGTLLIQNPYMLVPHGSTCTVTDATNATPIVVTCSGSHGFTSGDTVYITGVVGNTAANGTWTILSTGATTFSLNGSAGNGAYSAGGTGNKFIPVAPRSYTYSIPTGTCTVNAASNATPIVIGCTAAHNFTTGQAVYVSGVGGNTAANGIWVVTFVGTTSFSLDGSVGNGVYTAGGTVKGSFRTTLYPTSTAVQTVTGSAAGFTYNVRYSLVSGGVASVFSEQWNITPTPTTTTVSAVRQPGTVTPTSTVNLSQLAQTGASGTREYHVCWNGSAWTACFQDEPPRNVTGTSDTMLDSDRAKLVTYSNASSIAVTLPQAGASTLFVSGWYTSVENRGAGLVTITPATSTIDGAASVTLPQHRGLKINSNGTNYFTQRGRGAPHDLSNTWTATQDFSGATAILIEKGTAAPSSGDCDAAGEVGSIYEQTGDPASVNFTTWICRQTGASTYAWHPVSHVAATSGPATCTAGGALFFDTDDAAGLNLFGCTAANTFTRLGRPTRWSAFGSGLCTSSVTLYLTMWPSGLCTNITEGVAQELLISSAGSLRNLRVKAGAGGVNGSSGVVTLRVNAGNTAVTCTLGTGTTCTDTANTAAVAAGDRVTISVTTQAVETLADVQVAFEY